MKSIIKIALVVLLITNYQLLITLNAQISINEDGSSPDASAMLDISSSDKGILIPRMTTSERQAVNSPATGLLVYDTDENSFWYYTTSWVEINTGNLTTITDIDGDTKIQVEESSDEDIIRFDLGGTEYFRMNNGRISVVNTGYSIFLGNNTGVNDDFTDNANVFIGNSAGRYNTSGEYNIYIGNQSGNNNTTGYKNVFLGYSAGKSNLTGYHNLLLGYQAGFSNDGPQNVFLGYQAGYNEAGSNKLYIENSNATSPLIYGEFDNDLLRINGTLNINNAFSFPTADGNANQILVTDGSGSLTWTDPTDTDDQTINVLSFSNNTLSLSLENDGESDQTVDLSSLELSLIEDGDGDTKVDVSSSDAISFQMDGTEYFNLDAGRIKVLNTGNSVFIGDYAGQNDDFSSNLNVGIGYFALKSNTSGTANMAVGTSALENCTGDFNVAFGSFAGHGNTSGDNNTYIGYSAGENIITGSKNVMIGNYAGGTADVSERLFIDNSNTDNPLIWGDFGNNELVFNGDVGIGTSPTKAKLEIEGSGSDQSFTSTHGVLIASGAGTNSSNTSTLSIYATSDVAANGYLAFSDARIKNIKGISDSKNDLNTLMNIQITDYTMKDTIEQGNQTIKKVIAQQVAEVYPQAVNTNLTDVIPNIYQRATIDEKGWVSFNEQWIIDNEQFKKGDKVQIYFDDKKELLEVLEVKENAFRVKQLATGNSQLATVFVYGKQVNDFHTVDYEAISMLNVSATQQLAKKVIDLEKENQQLKNQVKKINQLEQQNAEMKAMLEQIQAQLNHSN